MLKTYDENGYVPDIIDDDGNKIPSEIFFNEKVMKRVRKILTHELDKDVLAKLRNAQKEIKDGD